MKNLPPKVWSAAAIPLALVVGIVVGRSSSSDSPSSKESAGNAGSNVPTRSEMAGRDGSSSSSRERGDRSVSSHNRSQQLTAILESSSRLDRTQRLLSFLDRLPTDQFASVYEEMANSPMSDIRGSERSLILQAWAERDPMATVGYLQENGAEDWERETSLSTWAAIDPAGAFAWATAAEDEGNVNNWVLGSMRGIAAASPELARDFLSQMENGETRERSIRSLEPYVLQYGYDYAENWISGISEEGLQNRTSRRFADELAEIDPARAAQWAASIQDAGTRREVAEDVADEWAKRDLNSAKDWVATLPEDARAQASEEMARHYARQDPQGATAWLQEFGDNPAYDDTRRNVARETYRENPAGSMEIVASITDERDRNRSYDRILQDWMRRDADSARSWAIANQASLPEHVIKRHLRQ
ncbi:hypothetical protein [Haloferula sp.]|uniref:hypothetical protein n=1 Tax=Haloferula sp. TaxID=2497595 RepID=UPI00329BC58D